MKSAAGDSVRICCFVWRSFAFGCRPCAIASRTFRSSPTRTGTGCSAKSASGPCSAPTRWRRSARHGWPGNVRELQNVIAGLALVAPSRGRVSARHVAQVLAGRELTASRVLSLDAARRVFERGQVAAALARHAGHRSAAAQELGLTRQGLAKAMKRLGLEDCDTAGVA